MQYLFTNKKPAKLPTPEIIAETDNWIAVNKPSGMLTLPDRHDNKLESLKGWMEQKFDKIFVVHRLDRDTSGLIVFAKNADTHKYLSGLFENREIEKYYIGLVNGSPLTEAGTLEYPLMEHPAKNGTMMVSPRGKYAKTDYTVLERFSMYTLIQFQIHTGRTHQIRVHSKMLGYPLVADPLYGDGLPFLLSSVKRAYKIGKYEENETPMLGRLALHAQKLIFTNPQGELITLEAPLFKDFTASLKQLRLHSKMR